MTYYSQTQCFDIRHPVLHFIQVLHMVRAQLEPAVGLVVTCGSTEHEWVLGQRDLLTNTKEEHP